MGKDKHENVHLIKHSQPKYLWFHVDNLSSAHVYIELTPEEQNIPFEKFEVPEHLLKDVAHLTKANSIKGNKVNNVTIIYTPVNNLHTDGTMDDGTVTFVNNKRVRKFLVPKKENDIINRLNKTKTEKSTQAFIDEQNQLAIELQRNAREGVRKLEEQKKQWAIDKKMASQPYMTEGEGDVDPDFRKDGFNWEEDFMSYSFIQF